MKDLNYEFIGWLKNGTSDKVWGSIRLNEPNKILNIKHLTFWGKRGTKYQTKIISSQSIYSSNIIGKILEKKKKGYIEVKKDKLYEIYPSFEDDIKDTAFWTVFTKTGDLTIEEWEYLKNSIL